MLLTAIFYCGNVRDMPSSTEIIDPDGWETLKELDIEPTEY